MTLKENTQTMLSYFAIGFFLLFLFNYHLMSALIGGMTVFLIIEAIHKAIQKNIHHKLSKFSNMVTTLIISLFTVTILTLLGLATYSIIQIGDNNFLNLGEDVFKILEQLKHYLPEYLLGYIPNNIIELKAHLIKIAKENYEDMLSITAHSAKALVHVIIGMFIGGIIAFSFLNGKIKTENQTPLIKEITKRISIFSNVFKKVVFAQVKISFINSILTGIYLVIALPLFDIHIPYAKTLVILTFLFGLIPVIGNLISNTLIFILSLMISFGVAVSSLIFLVVIHKLEYYINAKIVGSEIKTSIWELLIVMILMETVFGIIGAILAPVIYGYIKEEMKIKHLI